MNQNSHCMHKNILKVSYFERGLSNSLKKVTSFFLLNPILFNRQLNCQKQKGTGASDQLLFRLWSKFRKIPLLVMYYLTKFDDVIQFLILKIPFANLCKRIYDIISYSTFICSFESGKCGCGKEGKKITKIWISREQKELFR